MATETEQQQSRLKELIAKGKEQGFLTYSEVNDHLPDDISDSEQIEDIISMINDMGITVYESAEAAPDADELLNAGDNTADEVAAEEAAAALAAVETEAGRTTDPVRMYMREMGTVELLTREGEIAIAKRIEEGIRDVLGAAAYFPGTVEYVLTNYDELSKEGKLADILVGYLDPADHVPPAAQVDLTASTDDKDDNTEERKGPDPVEAKRRFTALKRAYNKSRRTLAAVGDRRDPVVLADLQKVSTAFAFFKLVPKHYDVAVDMPRAALRTIRRQERIIMDACVEAGMTRREFLAAYTGNEASIDWVNERIEGRYDYSKRLARFKEEIRRAQRKLATVTDGHRPRGGGDQGDQSPHVSWQGQGRTCQEGHGGGQPAPGDLDCEEVHQPRPAVPRSHPGRQHRPHEGGGQVRVPPGLQVLDLRYLVDPPGDHPIHRRPGAHHPHSCAHDRDDQQAQANFPADAPGNGSGTDAGRTRRTHGDAGGQGPARAQDRQGTGIDGNAGR